MIDKEPPHHNPIQVVCFIGKSTTTMNNAIERARRELKEWYALQGILFDSAGGSIFQFATTAYETADEYTFIITVFDVRTA